MKQEEVAKLIKGVNNMEELKLVSPCVTCPKDKGCRHSKCPHWQARIIYLNAKQVVDKLRAELIKKDKKYN